MNMDRLRTDLADLAEEATPVDLRDRALRTSRRLGVQRTLASTAAALVMLGAATGTAFALLPKDNNAGPAPAATTPAVVTPAPTATSNPAPSESATATDVGPTDSANTPSGTFGQIFYVAGQSMDPPPSSPLYSWSPGRAPRSLMSLDWLAAQSNVDVSPDGKRVSWVDEAGKLSVADVDGANQRTLPGTFEGLCWGPIWAPDSRRLTAMGADVGDKPGVLDVGSEKFTPLGELPGCHPLWSADGSTIAVASDGQVVLMNSSGKERRAVPGVSGGANSKRGTADLASLSPDGRRLALLIKYPGDEWGDVGRQLQVNAVIDTRTGRDIELPLGGRKLNQAVFQEDGTLIARVHSGNGYTLVLISADGRKITEAAEPAALRGMTLLRATD
jgi:Tol biopolymer transport system component